jgi:acetyl-CoA acetyltransferase family protein
MQKPEGAFPTGAPAVFDTSLGWRFPNPKMAALFPLEQMGETAENLVEKFAISRADQDAFSLRSHKLAVEATQSSAFAREILAVSLPQKKGDAVTVKHDEQPRADTTIEALAKLKAAFRDGGTVTAGNSSTLNDGAAATLIVSRAFATAHGLKPRARILASASAGVDPRTMGIGPVPATQKALLRAGLDVKDLDAVELNEAFAAQALAVMRSLKLDEAIVNRRGGAIALGHPLGCSGVRILTTLLHVLEDRGGTLGLATLCVGVGQGLSVVIERESA